MVGKLVRIEVAQQLQSDLVWKLHDKVQLSILTSFFQQIGNRKAHKTLRSAERAPTLSARCVDTFKCWNVCTLVLSPAVYYMNNCVSSIDESRWVDVPSKDQS